MKIQFDNDQPFQAAATSSVTGLFEGQPLAQGQFEIRLESSEGLPITDLGRGNRLSLSEETLLTNLQAVQGRNSLPLSEKLEGRNFSVEMETGTGKTYVYLRTIYELHQRYGFSKFIIVVPSVAIREGVLKSLQLMKDDLAALYGNTPCDRWVYDSRRVSNVRQFASANTLQILIINIQAFDKSATIMNKENDRMNGRKPLDFVQAAHPIVILDEPQNMETEIAKGAIAALNPLCTLRYSATHRNRYNLVYRLGPVQAYDLNLVKRIEVDSVLDGEDFNRPYLKLESVSATATKITAKLTLDIKMATGIHRKTISLTKAGEDLKELSNERTVYDGYIVEEINAGEKYITFSNGITLNDGEQQGARVDDVMKIQVYETVKEHLDKELRILQQLPEGGRVKVLSLFFIDRVAHYASAEGKIRKWFIEAYEELSKRPRYVPLSPLPVERVHNGYFAQSRGLAKDTTGSTAADDEAYELIMKDKERLMDRAEPLRFIFSHSALREGWDNPNVFQICTLNEGRSEVKKRQEIGRGLRLPVDETGNRIFDTSIARLTVIANESYSDFARSLQTEIETDTGEKFTGRLSNTRDRKKAHLIPNWRENADFVALWEQIKHRTRYSVDYETDALVAKAAEYLRKSPDVVAPTITVQKRALAISEAGLGSTILTAQQDVAGYRTSGLPDLLGYLQRETRLTRSTLARVLTDSGRLADVYTNPQQFLDLASRAIQVAKHEIMIDGIKYERLQGSDSVWEMMLFEEKEINGYITRMVEVGNGIYDAIECDSETERRFAEGLKDRQDIKLFLKLPRWFKIETPLGTYNPDWAVVKQVEDKPRVYLVRETKSTTESFAIRPTEEAKIVCGKKHFETAPLVEFAKVSDPSQV
ncbi:MAG: DEAD/DEAH box helicase family protein [Armatimonadota bacterium]|nr:DEAD/DEAH box helicase family protein [Armatimonadota bacterium]